MRPLFKSRTEALLLVLFLTSHLVLLSTQLPKTSSTPLVRALAMEFVFPLVRGIVGSISGLSNLWESYVRLGIDKQEYHRLKREVQEYRRMLLTYDEEIKRTSRLEVLDRVNAAMNRPGISAEVIGGDDRFGYGSRVVNKGSNSGVSWDCAVINPDGVVGRVVHVSNSSAVIQLISDRDSGVGVLLETSRAAGVLLGTGQQTATLNYISPVEKVLPGERVITSGLDQIYPKGLLVGRVMSPVAEKTRFQEFEVLIAARMHQLEELLILKKESKGP